MSTTSAELTPSAARLGPILGTGVVVVASVLLGAATSFAQGFLPDAISSFANSASGWTILTVVLVWFIRSGTGLSAVLGAIGFVSLVLGYTLASELRGISYAPILFVIVGVIVGPFIGVAASWLHGHEWKAALGVGLLSGIGVGEGIYGLTVISDTTHPFYWIFVASLGVLLLVVVIVRRIRRALVLVSAAAMTATVAVAFILAYIGLGTV